MLQYSILHYQVYIPVGPYLLVHHLYFHMASLLSLYRALEQHTDW